jgi:outer membrane protein TolC
MKQITLLFLLLLAFLGAHGQNPTATEEEWQEKFFKADEALPLLMEAAIKYSTEIEKLNLTKEIAQEDLKIQRKEILSGIGLGSGYTYGTRLGLGIDNPQQNTFNAFVLPVQAQYNVGLMVSLPISQVLNRGSQINKRKMMIMQAEADRKGVEKQIRQLVINLYQEIVMAKAQLKLHQEAYQSASIHYKLAEKQFEKGGISLPEMAKISETYNGAASARGTSQVKYATVILMMEELIGMKLYELMNVK